MAQLRIEATKNQFQWMLDLEKMIPEMNSQALGYIGWKSKHILMNDILDGQVLQMRRGYKNKGRKWMDTIGRRKASYSIRWNTRVTIASYPTNLFTKGTAPRQVFEPLARKVESQMQGILNDFDKKIFQKKISLIMGKYKKGG